MKKQHVILMTGNTIFNDYDIFKEVMDRSLKHMKDTHDIKLITAPGLGVVSLTRQYARENKLKYRHFRPDRKNYQDYAKDFNEELIVSIADECIHFKQTNSINCKRVLHLVRQKRIPFQLVHLKRRANTCQKKLDL